MNVGAFLERLEGVRPRGQGRWSARCPAHVDRSPSLSIREAEDGRLLIHDFGGCATAEIVAALGLTVSDLFSNAFPRGQRHESRPSKVDRAAVAFRFELGALDRRLRAEKILSLAKGVVADRFSNEELDRALEAVGTGYEDLEKAELFEVIADGIRARMAGESGMRNVEAD